MGSGKTTVGGILAKRLNRLFVDTDSMIESRHGPIPQIVADHGWDTFRSMELKMAKRLSQRAGLVISTGGRLMLNPKCAAYLEPVSDVVWLRATPEAIVDRVLNAPDADPSKRPLLVSGDGSPQEVIERLLQERDVLYGRYEVVDTSLLNPHEVADAVLDMLGFRDV